MGKVRHNLLSPLVFHANILKQPGSIKDSTTEIKFLFFFNRLVDFNTLWYQFFSLLLFLFIQENRWLGWIKINIRTKRQSYIYKCRTERTRLVIHGRISKIFIIHFNHNKICKFTWRWFFSIDLLTLIFFNKLTKSIDGLLNNFMTIIRHRK